MNFCVAIENAKVGAHILHSAHIYMQYHRNALLFAVGFVLSEDAETVYSSKVTYLLIVQDVYEPALRKLSSTLHTLEIECEYLFNSETKVSSSLFYYFITAVEQIGYHS